jgi:hypothetical protein
MEVSRRLDERLLGQTVKEERRGVPQPGQRPRVASAGYLGRGEWREEWSGELCRSRRPVFRGL